MNDARLQDAGSHFVFKTLYFPSRLVAIHSLFGWRLIFVLLSTIPPVGIFTEEPVRAALPPIVDYLYPSGAQRGTTVITVTDCIVQPPQQEGITAKLDPWPVGVWTNCQGLQITPMETCGEFQVEVGDDAPLGTHLIRLYTPDGTSVPRMFVVGHYPEIIESGPDGGEETATVVESLPVTINGRLRHPPYFDDVGSQKWDGDVDSYVVRLEADRWFVARLYAYSLGSPVDPVLQLRDEEGRVLATNHDDRNLDPLLAYRIEKAGKYVVQVMGFKWPPRGNPSSQRVKFTGSDAAVYRLSLTCGAFGRYAFPLGIQRGRKTMVTLHGWNLNSTDRLLRHELNAIALDTGVQEMLIGPPIVGNQVAVAVSDMPELLDGEPNDQLDQAQSISIPVVLNGRIGSAGDVDRFVFHAAKDQKLIFRFDARKLGLSFNGKLWIEDEAGKQLAEKTSPTSAPQWEWTAPADGLFTVVVGDLSGRGGDDYIYRMEVLPSSPDNNAGDDLASSSLLDFYVRANTHAFSIEPGRTTEIKVTVTPVSGFEASFGLFMEGLPEGITWTTPQIPRQGGEVTVVLSANLDAAPINAPFRVGVVSGDSSQPFVRWAFAPIDNRGENRLVDQTDDLWLTVISRPLAEPDKVVKEVP